MQFIENKTFAELAIGDTATLVRTLGQEDIELFAVMSGDVNPAHVDPDFAATIVREQLNVVHPDELVLELEPQK